VLTRTEAVQLLYDDTKLPTTTIVGAFGILDKSGCKLLLDNVMAAAWTAYKTYETYVPQSQADFRELAPVAEANLLQRELDILESVGWAVPARTRVDAVDNLAHAMGVTELDYGRAAVLSLVVDECAKMTDAQYARVVLCAAAQLSRTPNIKWTAKLASADIGADYIMAWAVRVACIGGPPVMKGVKRKRV